MKKKFAILLAALLITGCKNTTNNNQQNNSNNTTNQTNTSNNNNTSSNTGTGDNNQENNTNEGNGEGTNTENGEGTNTENGNTNEEIELYKDVSITDTFVDPGFPNDYMYKDDLMDEGVYSDPISLNSALSNDFNSISKHYYEGNFTNKLPEPKSTVSNIDELVYLFEYCGFYGIKNFNVKFDSTYARVAVENELNRAFWASRMLGQTAGFNFANNANGFIDITFLYNEFAATAINKNITSIAPINPYKITTTEGKFINDVPYTPTKGDLDVYNSDQLIFALENGYNPKMVKDSRVDLIYRKACYVITHTITDKMDELQKLYVINDTLFNLADYDSDGEYIASGILADSQLEARFPAALASTFVSFFAEGPLLYGLATCAGFAKAQSLLFALLNIKHQRVTGGNVDLEDTIYSKNADEGYWYHEYNYYIDSNDKYYVSDITYSSGGNIRQVGDKSYRFPARPICAAFTRELWGQTYDPRGIFNDIIKVYKRDSLGTEDLEYYKHVIISGNVNTLVTDYASIKAAVDAGKEAINAYKTKNKITTEQVYILSLVSGVTYEDRLVFASGVEQVASEISDILPSYWYYYLYGANFFIYM